MSKFFSFFEDMSPLAVAGFLLFMIPLGVVLFAFWGMVASVFFMWATVPEKMIGEWWAWFLLIGLSLNAWWWVKDRFSS